MKTYKVLTFGAGSWNAAEAEANVREKHRVRPCVYATPAIALRVANHIVGTGSCTRAVVASCDDEAAEKDADISEVSGRGWRRI